ncbi:MAG: oxidoreductase [Rhizobacter sp.]|nr:oxidoreductase [Rhizobacter sp.]
MNMIADVMRADRGLAKKAGEAKPTVLLVGGGGLLGSSMLEGLLADRSFGHVRVLATPRLRVAMRGLEPLTMTAAEEASVTRLGEPTPGALPMPTPTPTPPSTPPQADIAVVVFDRERHANGRDLGFVRPTPDALPQLARWLHRNGVMQLLVVMPHQASNMPQTLMAGLADLDEQAVASIGFSHVVFVRSAAPPPKAAGVWLQRFAHGLLAQLLFMVPQAHQPVRARKVAQFVGALASALPSATAGTRVAPPTLVWQASQMEAPQALVDTWLAGGELPPLHVPKRRM